MSEIAPPSSKAKELVPAPIQKPVWNAPEPTDPRQQFKREQRAWRKAEAERIIAELEAGPQKYWVALFGEKNGPQLYVKRLGQPVKALLVGATSPDEAKGKFARYNKIASGFENIRIIEGPASN